MWEQAQVRQLGNYLESNMLPRAASVTQRAKIGGRAQRLHVAALVVVNAFGDVVDPKTGTILAGTRRVKHGNETMERWLNTAQAMQADLAEVGARYTNTTIGAVLTDAPLTTEEANIVAMMAHSGIARGTRPAHSMYDGDTLFVLEAVQVRVEFVGNWRYSRGMRGRSHHSRRQECSRSRRGQTWNE